MWNACNINASSIAASSAVSFKNLTDIVSVPLALDGAEFFSNLIIFSLAMLISCIVSPGELEY